ncbi:hypothetical protein HDU86_004578 [Geranomyces michiganensis]|nr:hypothetical protein HDU86_004578 [Geranomyces michiganensis]
MHGVIKYLACFRKNGTPSNYTTEHFERQHKKDIKRPYTESNRLNYVEQLNGEKEEGDDEHSEESEEQSSGDNATELEDEGARKSSPRTPSPTGAPTSAPICQTPCLKFGFGSAGSSPSSDGTESVASCELESQGVVVARLKNAIQSLSSKEWKIEGIDVVAAIRKMQKLLLKSIGTTGNVEVHSEEHLLSYSCLILTEAKAKMWDKFFTDSQWASLRGFFDARLLVQDEQVWTKARIEGKRMIDAKKKGMAFRANIENESNLEHCGMGAVLDTLFHNLRAQKPDRSTNEPT